MQFSRSEMKKLLTAPLDRQNFDSGNYVPRIFRFWN